MARVGLDRALHPLEPRCGARATLLTLGAATLVSLALEPSSELVARPGLWFWIAVMAMALAVPFLVQRRQGVFEPFTPLTYPVWTYLGPVFVVGSAVLAAGIAQQAPDLIPAPVGQYYCLALAYLVVGWVGLLAGYYSRWGESMGSRVHSWLPKPEWSNAELRVSATLLLVAGLGLYWLAFRTGVLGYQRLATVGPYDSLLIFLSFVSHVAVFLLWFSLFGRRAWSRSEWALAAAVYLVGPLNLVISASRAGLVTHLLILAFAFRSTGRRIRWRHVLLFAALGVTSLVIGTAWSTTYRLHKGNETAIYQELDETPIDQELDETPIDQELDEAPIDHSQAAPFIDLLTGTAQTTAERGLRDNAIFVLRNLAVRIEITSSVATLVANYRRLRPLEEELGLADNIWRDTWTSPVPRFLWPSKPKVSDARTYSQAYFRYGDNSFAITPAGDLLRNFGPAGIPLGMALLGLALRLLYSALASNQTTQAAHGAVYTIVLINVSYEGFYGSILPTVLRLFVVVGGSLLAVHLGALVQRRLRRRGRA